ncbi:MAG: hypothetical protein JSS65_11570 [Armatimonadetes bacterium]|nr:hypothetical protein [Armatimonadota bacterium]
MAKWKAALLVSFFLAFPLAGMLIVWFDTHGKIRMRAEEFAMTGADSTFGQWSGEAVDANWNAEVDTKRPQAADWQKWKEAYGEAAGKVTVESYNSFTSERKDSMWQVVKLRVHVPGSKKKAVADVEVARMTMGPKWHFESVSVQDDKP